MPCNSPLEPTKISHGYLRFLNNLASWKPVTNSNPLSISDLFLQLSWLFADVIVSLEIDEMRIDQCVHDVLVTEQLHDVQNIFGAVIFHCCFEVAEGFEANLEEAWIIDSRATRSRCRSKLRMKTFIDFIGSIVGLRKIVCHVCGSRLNIARSRFETLHCLGLLFFSGRTHSSVH